MCDALRELMKDDLAQAEIKGERKGIRKGKLESLTNVMKSLSLDAERAMDALNIPAAEREIYRSQLP